MQYSVSLMRPLFPHIAYISYIIWSFVSGIVSWPIVFPDPVPTFPVPCVYQKHKLRPLCECDALPVPPWSSDSPQEHWHHDHQGEHRGRVQQSGARGQTAQHNQFDCLLKHMHPQTPLFSSCLSFFTTSSLLKWEWSTSHLLTYSDYLSYIHSILIHLGPPSSCPVFSWKKCENFCWIHRTLS